MKDYYSITHSTCNENGHEQLELEHHKSFLRWLFRKQAKKETYVSCGKHLSWKDKITGKEVSLNKYYKIIYAIKHLHSSRYLLD